MASIEAPAAFTTKLRYYGELVMFSNTLFSVSFGLVAMIVAAGGLPPLNTICWICVALLAGRTAANALNRIVDRDIDAKDPRTAGRHLPAGKLRTRQVWLFTIINFLLLALAAGMLRPICLYLLPIAVALFFVYSYAKRFTWLCHVILGLACAVAPAGAWIAVTGHLSVTGMLLAAADTFWVAGFDIIYAVQDREFDASQKLHSLPVRFGETISLRISAIFHAVALLLLLLFGYAVVDLGIVYTLGVVAVGLLLLYEHRLVSPHHYTKVTFASYRMNQVISVVFLLTVCMDIFI